MPKMITKLTAAQKARFPEFVQKWIEIGLSTRPVNRERAERAIAGLYRLANLKEPIVIWLPCPISAAISAVVYAKMIQYRLRPEVNTAVDSAVYSAVYSEVDSAVRSAVRSAVISEVESEVESAVISAVESAVISEVESAVYSEIYSEVYSAVYSEVESEVESAVISAVESAVISEVDSAVRSAVDSAVYSAVYSEVDSAVRSAVRSAVISEVESAVISAVRSAVISEVESEVESAVISAVESAVISAGKSFFGGALWNTGYSAWADYFNEVCGIAIDRNFLEMTENCGFYWTLDGICFASERPSEIHRDGEGRLHAENGASIKYAGTGWGLFHWHGTRVPGEWITRRSKLTPKIALTWENIEQRRAACEILGWSRILTELNAITIDKDQDPEIGELVEVDIPNVGREKFLRVLCGTKREFALPVPPNMETALDAQAWTWGLTEKTFVKPEIRT